MDFTVMGHRGIDLGPALIFKLGDMLYLVLAW